MLIFFFVSRKSIKKTKDHFNINREIVKLRHDFNNINLKNRITLKGLDNLNLKIKSEFFNDDFLVNDDIDANDDETNIILPEFSDSQELEIRNDNEFKLNPQVKAANRIKFYRETRINKRLNRCNSELLDLNKDINENNEDIFKITCVNKSPKFQPENENVEESTKNIHKNNIPPNHTESPIGDLQKLLVMMTITTKPTKNEELCDEIEINNEEIPNNELYYYDHNDDNIASYNTTEYEGIDNILTIKPFRLQMNDKIKYLMEKYVGKWKEYVNKRKQFMEQQRQATLNNFFDKIAKKKMDIKQSDQAENIAKMHLRDYNTYQHR